MPETIDIKKFIRSLPKSRRGQLTAADKLGKKLRKTGLARRGYRLSSPFAPARVNVGGDPAGTDPRTVQLRRQ